MNNENSAGSCAPQSGLGQALKTTAETMENLAAGASRQFGQNFNKTCQKLQEMQAALADLTRDAARDADFYVHENPWKSISIAALGGVILGLLLRRR